MIFINHEKTKVDYKEKDNIVLNLNIFDECQLNNTSNDKKENIDIKIESLNVKFDENKDKHDENIIKKNRMRLLMRIL